MEASIVEEDSSVQTVEDCKAVCQSKWETCTAFTFNDSDKTCTTYSENLTMMGDHDILFDCYITSELALTNEERDDGFYRSIGQCALLDKSKTELFFS